MKVLEELSGLVSSKIEVMKTIFSIFKLEARLAGLSIFPILITMCLLLALLVIIWFSAMVLLGSLILMTWSDIFIAINSVLFLNVLLFLGLLKYLSFNLKQMSFAKTRELITKKEDQDNEQTNKDNFPNSPDGNQTELSTGHGSEA